MVKGNFKRLFERYMKGTRNTYTDKDLRISTGGYDLLFEVYYEGIPIIDVFRGGQIQVVNNQGINKNILEKWVNIINCEFTRDKDKHWSEKRWSTRRTFN